MRIDACYFEVCRCVGVSRQDGNSCWFFLVERIMPCERKQKEFYNPHSNDDDGLGSGLSLGLASQKHETSQPHLTTAGSLSAAASWRETLRVAGLTW